MHHRTGGALDETVRALRAPGTHLIPAAALTRALGLGPGSWAAYGRHWDELRPDPYAAELGLRRLRRYGRFRYGVDGEELVRLPHTAFVQPHRSNRLYIGRDRLFEPLTESFAADPVLHAVVRFLAGPARTLDDTPAWLVNVTPFRVLAAGGAHGDPTPEGVHRDGVTLVSSLLIGRDNAEGGASSVYDADGNLLLTTTLTEPGTLLVGDDRSTLHGVSEIRPADPGRPARRDVLVVTFTV